MSEIKDKELEAGKTGRGVSALTRLLAPREIRFRAWDKHNGNMHYQNPQPFYTQMLYSFFKNAWWHENNGNEMELMQYTGQKDNIGEKIFEADLLELNNVTWLVKWDSDYSRFYAERVAGHLHRDIMADEFELTKIVGNLFKNPELLE